MSDELHSICEHCAPLMNGKYGKVFAGALAGAAVKQQCCCCGHEHDTGMVVTFYDTEDGQRVSPWWCAGKLGIHRAGAALVREVRS